MKQIAKRDLIIGVTRPRSGGSVPQEAEEVFSRGVWVGGWGGEEHEDP